MVLPDMHRRNMDEKAIQAFKDHFLVILSGVDSSFPLHLWDRLSPQAEMTLNLLRQSKVEPKVSAWAYLSGPQDYNASPLWRSWDVQSSFMKNHGNENIGTHMLAIDGTSEHPMSIVDVSECIKRKQEPKVCQILFISNTNIP